MLDISYEKNIYIIFFVGLTSASFLRHELAGVTTSWPVLNNQIQCLKTLENTNNTTNVCDFLSSPSQHLFRCCCGC